MKAYIKIIILTLGIGTFLASCECKVCKKEGENDVKVCRDNYDTQEDYNQALGWYQLGGFSCNGI
jgi:hypothetical protein